MTICGLSRMRYVIDGRIDEWHGLGRKDGREDPHAGRVWTELKHGSRSALAVPGVSSSSLSKEIPRGEHLNVGNVGRF